ncbi:hypothetical protein MMC18_000448 [Xylographa bjoerkii]|nr:hypothetical protein [Xylographa bjoerkii]
MCRQYKDYGSAKRDAEECNLNSLDFPEFRSFTSHANELNREDQNGSANGSHTSAARLAHSNGALDVLAQKRQLGSSENIVNDSMHASAKDDLMAITEFERSCMQLALKRLTQISPPATIHKLQVFIDVTDLFGQIYVQKDIASRVKHPRQ